MQPARENFRGIPVLLLSCSYYIKKKATRKPGSFQIFIYVNYRISKNDTTPGPLSFRIKVIIKTEAVISCSVIHNDTNIEKFSETDYFFSKKIALDSHDILFLSCDKSVDFLNVLIGNFLDFLFTLFLSVLRKAFVLLCLLQSIDSITTSVADNELGVLTCGLCLLDEFLSSLLCKRRNVATDLLTVILRCHSDICIDDSFLDLGDHALLPWLDKYSLGIRSCN